MPPEIQGNYSPALISCYAWSDSGIEANGACEKLYVYGYDDSATTDTEGPEIEYFYVNTPSLAPGTAVNTSPVVFARLRDESGINISQSGIGHSLVLTIDWHMPTTTDSIHISNRIRPIPTSAHWSIRSRT